MLNSTTLLLGPTNSFQPRNNSNSSLPCNSAITNSNNNNSNINNNNNNNNVKRNSNEKFSNAKLASSPTNKCFVFKSNGKSMPIGGQLSDDEVRQPTVEQTVSDDEENNLPSTKTKNPSLSESLRQLNCLKSPRSPSSPNAFSLRRPTDPLHQPFSPSSPTSPPSSQFSASLSTVQPPLFAAPPPPPPPPPGAPAPPLASSITRLNSRRGPRLRRLAWQKLPPTAIIGGGESLWTTRADGLTIDVSRIEELFALPADADNGVAKMKGGDHVTKSEDLLENRKSMNLAIWLRKYLTVWSLTEVVGAIIALDSASLGDADRVAALAKSLPDDTEERKLLEFKGDVERLPLPEKFCLLLCRQPNYKEFVEFMHLREEFSKNFDFLKPVFEIMIKCSKDLRKSSTLKNLLHAVLQIGNCLNAGGNAGGAAGFKLESLLNLDSIKSNVGSLTLLHYIVQECEKNNVSMKKLLYENPYLKEVTQYSMENVFSEMQALLKSKNEIQVLKFTTCNASLIEKIDQFLEMANGDTDDIKKDESILKEEVAKLEEYFCEEMTIMQLDHYLKVIHKFCENCVKAGQDCEEIKLKKEKSTDCDSALIPLLCVHG